MDRLTIKTPQGPALKMGDTYSSEGAAREDLMILYYIAVERLAEYEDTGLEPDEVVQAKLVLMGKAIAEIKEFEGIPVDRMIKLAQAEKEGRLVVMQSRQDLLEFCPMRVCGNGNCSPVGGFCQPGTEICKAMQAAYGFGVFNAREEAETALKKREADNEAD